MSENEAIIRKLEAEIENISRFPDENPHSVIRVSFGGDLLFANSASRNTLIKDFDHNGDFKYGEVTNGNLGATCIYGHINHFGTNKAAIFVGTKVSQKGTGLVLAEAIAAN